MNQFLGLDNVFNNVDNIIYYWLIIKFLDIITGIFQAFYNKDFQSCKMRIGLFRVAGEFLILILFGVIDCIFKLNIATFIVGCGIYILKDLFSIIENLKKMGLPIPAVISNTLSGFQTVLEDEENEIKLKEGNK